MVKGEIYMKRIIALIISFSSCFCASACSMVSKVNTGTVDELQSTQTSYVQSNEMTIAEATTVSYEQLKKVFTPTEVRAKETKMLKGSVLPIYNTENKTGLFPTVLDFTNQLKTSKITESEYIVLPKSIPTALTLEGTFETFQIEVSDEYVNCSLEQIVNIQDGTLCYKKGVSLFEIRCGMNALSEEELQDFSKELAESKIPNSIGEINNYKNKNNIEMVISIGDLSIDGACGISTFIGSYREIMASFVYEGFLVEVRWLCPYDVYLQVDRTEIPILDAIEMEKIEL